MSYLVDFERPVIPGANQGGLTGSIRFEVEVVQTPGSIPQVQIKGYTSADDRAICEILLSHPLETEALANLRSALERGIAADQTRFDPSLRFNEADIPSIAEALFVPGGGHWRET